jgi:hypothetical protein
LNNGKWRALPFHRVLPIQEQSQHFLYYVKQRIPKEDHTDFNLHYQCYFHSDLLGVEKEKGRKFKSITKNKSMKNLIIPFLTFLFACSCGQSGDRLVIFKQLGINNTKWKNDSFGCHGYRYKTSKIITENSSKILGAKKKSCEDFFGIPNLKRKLISDREIWFYNQDPSNLSCQGKANEPSNISESVRLHFVFDKNDNLVDIGMKVQ